MGATKPDDRVTYCMTYFELLTCHVTTEVAVHVCSYILAFYVDVAAGILYVVTDASRFVSSPATCGGYHSAIAGDLGLLGCDALGGVLDVFRRFVVFDPEDRITVRSVEN